MKKKYIKIDGKNILRPKITVTTKSIITKTIEVEVPLPYYWRTKTDNYETFGRFNGEFHYVIHKKIDGCCEAEYHLTKSCTVPEECFDPKSQISLAEFDAMVAELSNMLNRVNRALFWDRGR